MKTKTTETKLCIGEQLRSRLCCFFIFALLIISSCSASAVSEFTETPGENPLAIPELIDTKETPEVTLSMQNARHEFFPGVSSTTRGFNSSYLGPTIRLHRDTEATINFVNELGEPTTVHGHGLHVPGEIDGGPHSIIAPDQTWSITIPVAQEAGTSWYHPHWT